MDDRMLWTRTVNDLNSHYPKSRGDCFDYGSWYGCDFECPQLQRGECNGDLLEIFEELDNDEIYELYDNGYYPNEVKDYLKGEQK